MTPQTKLYNYIKSLNETSDFADCYKIESTEFTTIDKKTGEKEIVKIHFEEDTYDDDSTGDMRSYQVASINPIDIEEIDAYELDANEVEEAIKSFETEVKGYLNTAKENFQIKINDIDEHLKKYKNI
jgi:hypothetical protein